MKRVAIRSGISILRPARPSANSRYMKRWMTDQPSNKPNWRQNGTPEIVIGTTILTLLGVDYYLQSEQEKSRQEIMSQLQNTIQQDEMKEKERSDLPSEEETKAMKSLFTCIVRRLPKYFDGSKCLMGVQVGDTVQVLEEHVGPDKMYHLCRLEKQNQKRGSTAVTVGWFPIQCLEKVKL